MAEGHSPLDHISDSYYFQLPPQMWRYDEAKIYQQVPQWVWDRPNEEGVRDGEPDFTPDELTHALDGKVIIPQPFGTPLSLYEAGSGFCISRLMIVMFAVACVLAIVFSWLAARLQGGKAPHGPLTNMLEAMVVFIRDTVAKPILHGDADAYLPFLLTLFFFIAGLNVAGMIPVIGTATATFSVTLALAITTLVVVLFVGMRQHGVIGFWKGMIPGVSLPVVMVPLLGLIFLIELGSFFIKHAVLSVRLVANVGGGHLVLAGLSMIPDVARDSNNWFIWFVAAAFTVVGATLFSLLELLVAFIQAYVFTMLTALFISAAKHHH
jgi:F-type H+-transporting ATPase subunit a